MKGHQGSEKVCAIADYSDQFEAFLNRSAILILGADGKKTDFYVFAVAERFEKNWQQIQIN